MPTPTEGTVESVATITADDLTAYRNKILARDNLKVAVVGDIDAATLGPMLDEIFGDLPVKANRVARCPTSLRARPRPSTCRCRSRRRSSRSPATG